MEASDLRLTRFPSMSNPEDFVRFCSEFKLLPSPEPYPLATISAGEMAALGFAWFEGSQKGIFYPKDGIIQGTFPADGAMLTWESIDSPLVLTHFHQCSSDQYHYHFRIKKRSWWR